MANWRSIPTEAWKQVFDVLVFYFSRRGLRQDAEDLAQKTLLAVLGREDFTFDDPSDFQKVCYGFANKILLAHLRQSRNTGIELDPSTPARHHDLGGLKHTDLEIFLKEVFALGEEELRDKDWELIQNAAEAILSHSPNNFPPAEANRIRVALHRARKKLGRLTGFSTKV
jgi:DNA-directed RNA polymerase specialized sigma24 family protein